MVLNFRLYTKSFQKTLVESNPVINTLIDLKKTFSDYFFLPKKSKELSKNIFEAKVKLVKTSTIIGSGSNKKNPGSINLIR